MISSIGTFLPIRGHFVWDGMGVCGVDGVLRRRGVGKATGGVLVMSLSVFRQGVEGQSIARPVRRTSITLGAYGLSVLKDLIAHYVMSHCTGTVRHLSLTLSNVVYHFVSRCPIKTPCLSQDPPRRGGNLLARLVLC